MRGRFGVATLVGVNRTDRLYALVEELRAVAPRPRSAAWLAARFEVSVRTIERDLDALRESGVPIWAEQGRLGGYTLDRERTLAPLSLTPEEALAISVALRSVAGSPFAAAARSASQKVRAGLPDAVRRSEEALASRVHEVDVPTAPAHAALLGAVAERRLVHLAYTDGAGAATERDVEPLGLLRGADDWYLMGWCRLRSGLRGFRIDRIASLDVLDERVPDRADVVDAELRRIEALPHRAGG